MGGFRDLLGIIEVTFQPAVQMHTALVSRYVLAILFLIAGIAKLHHPMAIGRTLMALGFTSERRARHGWILGAIETGTGLLLSVDVTSAVGSTLAILLLLTFICVSGSALLRGLVVPCNCFGEGEAAIGRRTIVRDVVLLLGAALVTYVSFQGKWLTPPHQRITHAAVAVVLVCIGGLIPAAMDIHSRNRQLHNELDWQWIVQHHAGGRVG